MSVTIENMRPKLLSLDTVHEKLAASEPFNSYGFPVGDGVKFKLGPAWNHGLDAIPPEGLVDAFVKIGKGMGAQEFQLSKEALLEATSLCGLPKGYVGRTPAHLIEPHMNYWFREGHEGKEFKILASGSNQVGSAFTKSTIVPFSNLRLLDQALEGIKEKYGDVEVLADYKFHHTLRGTHVRLIIPGASRLVTGSGVDDDQWSIGLQIKNSIIGESQTELSGYLFRWWCTNGAIDTRATSGVWSRRGGGQGDEVYEWARTAVDDVLGGLESSLDHVQAMTEIPLTGEANLVLQDVFEQYKVPTVERNRITDLMVDETNLTLYTLMQAITQTANNIEVDPGHVERLMRVGGDLVHVGNHRCGECRRILP